MDSTYPRISIVTPCFNSEQFIEQTLDSVISQSYPNLQYIVIDGGSIDGTVNIIDRYRQHISYFISEPDQGQADAIRKGLAIANGQVFNWINADDTYLPGALNIVGEIFQDPRINLLAARSNIFGISKPRISPGTFLDCESITRLIARARIDQPETFFRLDKIKSIGGIDSSYHYLMDLELWLRYLINIGISGVAKTDQVLVNFRLHPSSKTVSAEHSAGWMAEEERLWNEFFAKTSSSGTLLSKSIRSRVDEDKLRQIRKEILIWRFLKAYGTQDFDAMNRVAKQVAYHGFLPVLCPSIFEKYTRVLIKHILNLTFSI